MTSFPFHVHGYTFNVPLTLRPSPGRDEVFNALIAAAVLRYHADQLYVQAWALALADEWEKRFVSQGWERFSLGYDDIDGFEKVPFAQMWMRGQKTTYVCKLNAFHGKWVISSTQVDLEEEPNRISDINEFILEKLRSFPVNPRQRLWSSAFYAAEGMTVEQWRESILGLLDPADLARYEQLELGIKTPQASDNTPPTRL